MKVLSFGATEAMPTGARTKVVSKVPFRDRDFVAWDGEGSKVDAGQRQPYILFGCSTGDEISSQGLRTDECLELICDVGLRNRDVIHSSFAFSYDVTQICFDLPTESQQRLHKEGHCYYKQWRLEWFKRKWFRVTDRKTKISVQIFDIFTFFNCKAIDAWRDYLPNDPDLAFVEAGKNQRAAFEYKDLSYVREYMHKELALYVKLIDKVRGLLTELDLYPSGWYGPGAVANAAMNKFGVGASIVRDLPEEVIVASQYAFSGGHFEGYLCGQYDGTVYDYDLNSAYPHALRLVPDLAHGEWTYRENVTIDDIRDFSLYHVRYRNTDGKRSLWTPSALPYRDRRHCVHYPNYVDSWYWGCEVIAASKYGNSEIELLGVWEFTPRSEHKPFGFLEHLYYQRRQWKDDGNPVHYAAKLVLNSMFGKTAQRVGWRDGKPPRWHQLEYAGYTIAKCRSMVWEAIAQNPESVIAVETDGVITTAPLDLDMGTGLGQWGVKTHDGIVFVQNGVYWMKNGDVWDKVKVRGFGKGDISIEHVLERLDSMEPLQAHTNRFAAMSGFAGKRELGSWIEKSVSVTWGGDGKRVHDPKTCHKCQGAYVQMHNTRIVSAGGISHKHVLPWKDEDVNPYQEFGEDDSITQLWPHSELSSVSSGEIGNARKSLVLS